MQFKKIPGPSGSFKRKEGIISSCRTGIYTCIKWTGGDVAVLLYHIIQYNNHIYSVNEFLKNIIPESPLKHIQNYSEELERKSIWHYCLIVLEEFNKRT